MPAAKRRLLSLLDLPPTWLELLADRPEAARVHVGGMGGQMLPAVLAERLAGARGGGEGGGDGGWDRVVAVRATGE